MKRLFCLLLALFLVEGAAAQFIDDFSDGDFTQTPSWSGDDDRWTIADLDGTPALRSDGLAQADTIYLSTPSEVSYGSWSFTFAHRDVNLSTFNGARVFLLADTPDLAGPVRGYYVQMGTNNSNQVRFYRIDGDPATQRVELGRSGELLAGESNTLRLHITRAQDNTWDVRVNGTTVFTAEDDTYLFSQYFGVWVKHTATRPQHIYFDAFEVQGDRGPVEDDPLTITYAEQVADSKVDVWFSGLIDRSTVTPSAFSLDDGTVAQSSTLTDDGTRVRLMFEAPLAGRHIHVDGVKDYGGNPPAQERADLAFQSEPGELLINEIMFNPRVDRFDPRPDQAEYVELYNTSDRLLTLHGLYWTGEVDKYGEADTLAFGQQLLAVPSREFALVFAEPEEVDDPARESRLAGAFPGTDLSPIALLPQARATLLLRNSGDRICLHRFDGTILDEVNYRPEWHHPAIHDTRGISLERLRPDRFSDDAGNWTSSVAEAGGTPGAPNSVKLADQDPSSEPALSVTPSPFYPEGAGEERIAVIRYTLTAPTNLVRARIFDSYGREVRTLEDAHLAGTSGELLWDGLTDSGRSLRMGIYVVHLEALDTANGVTETHRAPVVLARPLD